ncbi:MAG: Calx-beta domain-containing protein [Myxococcales bacterium]
MTTATGDTPSTPTVSIVSNGNASESGPTSNTFTVSRTGSTSSSLAVSYTVGGTASAGPDYTSLSGSVTIPAGYSSANITVTPQQDSTYEGNETVIATLTDGGSYDLGTPYTATMTIK